MFQILEVFPLLYLAAVSKAIYQPNNFCKSRQKLLSLWLAGNAAAMHGIGPIAPCQAAVVHAWNREQTSVHQPAAIDHAALGHASRSMIALSPDCNL